VEALLRSKTKVEGKKDENRTRRKCLVLVVISLIGLHGVVQ
jgi:hypothetical protein